MGPVIRRLDDQLVNRIAAGEVVERPASVVKELVENALDAGARRIRVELEEGGKTRIRVLDDGMGVPADQLPLVFERHATSKIHRPEDLDAITSLGFRGEALPSIGAVARVRFRSRLRGTAEGAVITWEGGRFQALAPAGGPEGTEVEVRDLFFNTPARLRFLKTTATERRRAVAVVTEMALAYPEVAFELWVEGRESLRTSGDGDPREAVAAVFGRERARRLIELEADGAGITLSGFLGPPDMARRDRSGQHLFINRRWVHSSPLGAAVERGYEGLLMTRQYPVFILHVGLDPAEVDVNVHPAKTEVRLRRERELFGLVVRAVRERLAGANLGRRLVRVEWEGEAGAGQGLDGGRPDRASLYETGRLFPGEVRDVAPAVGATEGWRRAAPGPEVAAAAGVDEVALPATLAVPEPGGEREAGAAGAGKELPPDETQAFRRLLRTCRVLGQLGRTYLVAEADDGLWLIDQHAAHERILFDRLRRAGSEPPVQQPLLVPIPLELGPERFELFWESREELAQLGFGLEPFGRHSLRVTALPVHLAGLADGGRLEAAVDELLELWQREGRRQPDRVLALLACKAAVKAGDALTQEQMDRLLQDLAATDVPFTCPHGRPTALSHPWSDLERRFGRRG